jgi:hypothetical protein
MNWSRCARSSISGTSEKNGEVFGQVLENEAKGAGDIQSTSA